MAFCTFCGEELPAGAIFCSTCGAKRNITNPTSAVPSHSTAGSAVAGKYISYAEVPWYRKNWFAILCFMVCMPVLLLVLITGDVYYEKNGKIERSSKTTKILVLVLGTLAVAYSVSLSLNFIHATAPSRVGQAVSARPVPPPIATNAPTSSGDVLTPSGTEFEDGGGNKYLFEINANGGVLKSTNVTIYLGNACDALSPELGKGTWSWANGGFVVSFSNGKSIGFPREEIAINNSDGCASED